MKDLFETPPRLNSEDDLPLLENWLTRLRLWLRENAEARFRINVQTGTSYTLVLSDSWKVVTMDNSSANTVTIPANSAVAFETDTRIYVTEKGSGNTTISADTGVTLNGVSAGSGTMTGQFDQVILMKVDTDEWIASGDINTVT